jgi:predicted metal-dependent hydrolase
VSLLPDSLVRSRRRSLSLRITPDARLVVRAPLRMPDAYIRQFIEHQKDWIEKKLTEVRKHREAHPPKKFVAGEVFPLCGRQLVLKISPEYRAIAEENGDLLFPAAFLRNSRIKIIQWYREQAAAVIGAVVEENRRRHGFSFHGFRINGATRRWGSCGPRNTLNFSWRLVLAPPEVINAVVVHELCHTLVKNHSAKFWAKVQAIIPNIKEYRTWLRKNCRHLDL